MSVSEITVNTSFWEKLYADTKNFEGPVLYKNFHDQPLLTEEEVRSILINWTNQPFDEARMGVDMTVKGEKRDSYDQRMYNLPFQSDKTIEELYNELIGDRRACILVRSPQQYYEPLAIRVANFIEPLLKQFGVPQLTWSTALFIGQYNYTPFGLHFDSGNQRAIHTMIKGKKKMWVWERDIVDKIMRSSGLTSFRYYCENEVEQLFSRGVSGACHEVEENDLYFLPASHYHITHVAEFSIGLSITFLRRDQNDLVTNAVESYVSQNITDNLQFSSLPFQRDNIDYMNLKETEEQIYKKGWLTNSVKEEILKAKSNLGMALPPQLKEISHENLNELTIKINAPFQIKWLTKENDLKLYVRSRVIPLSFSETQEQTFSLIPILERLNNGEELKFLTFAKLLEDEMEQEDIVHLANVLYRYGGILFE